MLNCLCVLCLICFCGGLGSCGLGYLSYWLVCFVWLLYVWFRLGDFVILILGLLAEFLLRFGCMYCFALVCLVVLGLI